MSQYEKWLAAADKYQAKRLQAERETPPAAPVKPATATPKHGTSVAEIDSALFNFFNSFEGEAAKCLLMQSKMFVRLAESNEGGGYGYVVFVDGDGLKESHEAMGMWTVYAQKTEILAPKVKKIGTNEAAVAIVSASEGRATADQVIANLRKELDRIAEDADKQ